MSTVTRRTYRVTLSVSVAVEADDKALTDVRQLVQEHVNVMYSKMERANIQVVLQHGCAVVETP